MPKEKIHPNYAAVRVMCACGNNFETRSTHKGDIHVEICSVCHPFFTGKQRLVDTAGRVERFRRKYAKATRHSSSGGQVTGCDAVCRLGLRCGGGLFHRAMMVVHGRGEFHCLLSPGYAAC